MTGHAFEARIYAENVPKGFLPATGVLHHYRPVPVSTTGVIMSPKASCLKINIKNKNLTFQISFLVLWFTSLNVVYQV